MTIEPYADGRWWPVDHRLNPRFPLLGRGNVGEVYPNVVSPLCGSLLNEPMSRGMQQAFWRVGMATRSQIGSLDGRELAVTPCHGGYLFGNVSLTRTLAARTPGLSIELIDRQMFGLTDAPPHRTGPGDRNLVVAARGAWSMAAALLRPDERSLDVDRADVEAYVSSVAVSASAADTDALLAVATSGSALWQRLMTDLIVTAAPAAIGRAMLDRLVADVGGDDLVNELTAGLGSIESAEPALDLWRLAQLDGRELELGLDEFRRRHGARGPDEWELASPTWGTDPQIALAAIEQLRNRGTGRDPEQVTADLAARRTSLAAETRAALPRLKRRGFDLALRAIARGATNREGTKAAYVRALMPTRVALAELARRSAFDHHGFFLLTIDEAHRALSDPTPFETVVDERRQRGAYLQARVPPFWFEGEVPAPDTWVLRSELRRPDPTPRTLQGLGVATGVATGTARIVTDPASPGALGPTDILVAPHTDPAWTPLFLAVAGVVVDVGAHLSHAAIVARELGVPTAVSVTGASSTIPDGALVTVDGGSGTVTVHPD